MGSLRAAVRAKRRQQRPVHMDQSPAARALVQVVDILGDEPEVAAPRRLEPCQRAMRSIGFDPAERRPAQVVEAVDEIGIVRERLRRAHILDPVFSSNAVRVGIFPIKISTLGAKRGDAGFGGNARAS